MVCNIKIFINEKSVAIKSILDTGNFLKDPISKLPVVVVEKRALEDIVPNYILDNLDKVINGNDVDLGEYISKVRLIPFSSLGKENGILLGIKADKVLLELEEKDMILNNVIIGIYNGILNKNGKYHALIGLEILENNDSKTLVYEN